VCVCGGGVQFSQPIKLNYNNLRAKENQVNHKMNHLFEVSFSEIHYHYSKLTWEGKIICFRCIYIHFAKYDSIHVLLRVTINK